MLNDQKIQGVGRDRKLKAIRECAEWLQICLKLGWNKSSLDDLERAWWKYHDDYGRWKEEKQNV